MSSYISVFLLLFVFNVVSSQLNGEFWWLHEKVAKLQQVEPPPPKFDDVNEFETDESVKIIFKDNELSTKEYLDDSATDIETFLNQGEKFPSAIIFQDHSELAKPFNTTNVIVYKNSNSSSLLENEVQNYKSNNKEMYSPNKNKTQTTEDEFEFMFPKSAELLWEDKIKKNTQNIVFNTSKNNDKKNNFKPNTITVNNKIWFEEEKKRFVSESICTFIEKEECVSNKGIVNVPRSYPKKGNYEKEKVCCIFPLGSKISFKIREPHNNFTIIKRYKRSDPVEQLSSALRQRNVILMRNNSQIQKNKVVAMATSAKPALRIATPDIVDPYWNVKNSKFRNPSTQDYQNSDYVEEYAAELPGPGLIGIYSENGKLQGESSWKVKNIKKSFTYGTDEVSEEDNENDSNPFGYSSFDPRLGESTKKPRATRRKSNRVTPISEDEEIENSESQTVNFHSTPDFRVLQGFKLVNLAGNKNRYVRKTTTERFQVSKEEEGSLEKSSTTSSDDEYIDAIDVDLQIHKKCGRILKSSLTNRNSGKEVTENGCDPWLAVVVSTKNPERILCYATIVHPRAAVTAADCVFGKTTGDVTIISGVWDLKRDRENAQQRMSTIFIHPQFNSGELENNIAMLHWKRPLGVDSKVQPACLGDPHVGDTCYFVGWGGYDRALQPRPHWQHATILTPRDCRDKISSPDINIPAGAFCASVQTRGTVTGVGGPLLCKAGGRISIVGVAVYRESIVVLLPTFEWIVTALNDLQIY